MIGPTSSDGLRLAIAVYHRRRERLMTYDADHGLRTLTTLIGRAAAPPTDMCLADQDVQWTRDRDLTLLRGNELLEIPDKPGAAARVVYQAPAGWHIWSFAVN